MIRLTGNIAVTADERQYIVGRPRTRPGKGVVLDGPRYYTTMAGVVKAAVSQCLRDRVADGAITELRDWLMAHVELG